ncbi:CPBP family intramembrane glutamic endopeptidase [Lentisalinibacter salinarum]|uniref:CPBP family intramembrane glutamic endopeptidase n=1 Tax=Lentisalinibacter salinarum TaxID=2992239 RepID=UPI00386A6A05
MEYDTATPTARDESADRLRAGTDILLVAAISAAAFAAESAAAGFLPWGAEARGVVAVLAGAIAAVLMTRHRGGTLADLGFREPRRWSTVPLWVVGILAAYIVAQGPVPLLVGQFLHVPEPDLSRYDALRGNLFGVLAMALVLPLTAAIPEEVLYRGFLIERLSRLLGPLPGSALIAVLLQALVFGSVHFQWGVGGVVVTTVMGIVWGIAFLLCGRNLWIVIIAHSAAHLALLAQLYFSPAPA